MELCIDTSTRYASVGISKEGRIVAELAWRSERNHSVELAPAMRRVMEHAGVRMEDLTAVFAAVGPGGFSALRVGLSVAKSLAMARGLPLVGINTLDIEAVPFHGLEGPLATVIGAGTLQGLSRQRMTARHLRATIASSNGKGWKKRSARVQSFAARRREP